MSSSLLVGSICSPTSPILAYGMWARHLQPPSEYVAIVVSTGFGQVDKDPSQMLISRVANAVLSEYK